jgi:hypothetical protein
MDSDNMQNRSWYVHAGSNLPQARQHTRLRRMHIYSEHAQHSCSRLLRSAHAGYDALTFQNCGGNLHPYMCMTVMVVGSISCTDFMLCLLLRTTSGHG